MNLGLVCPELNTLTTTKLLAVSASQNVFWTHCLPKAPFQWAAIFLGWKKHIEICNVKPLRLIKARITVHELLFKLFVKINVGPSLLSHRPTCEMLGPNLLLDLKLLLNKQISKALITVSGAGDK